MNELYANQPRENVLLISYDLIAVKEVRLIILSTYCTLLVRTNATPIKPLTLKEDVRVFDDEQPKSGRSDITQLNVLPIL
jgi:hypothetical protein